MFDPGQAGQKRPRAGGDEDGLGGDFLSRAEADAVGAGEDRAVLENRHIMVGRRLAVEAFEPIDLGDGIELVASEERGSLVVGLRAPDEVERFRGLRRFLELRFGLADIDGDPDHLVVAVLLF